MKIAIVGNGAIGNLLAARCQSSGLSYQLLTRSGEPLTINFTDINGHSSILTPQVRAIEQPDSFDFLILPLKAAQIIPALKQLRPQLKPTQQIILLHNGMGCIDQAKALLPNIPLLAATTSYAAYKPADNQCIETGLGDSHIGWLSRQAKNSASSVLALLDTLLPPCTWHEDILPALWFKLTINAAINPLTALEQITNGQLRQEKYQKLIRQICEESHAVMQALEIKIELDEILTRVYQVIDLTANNFSSMNRDIALKRSTEIGFINGHVVAMGNKLGVATPANLELLERMTRLEAKQTSLTE
jgi:2-dehydropantoate 2-reductase